MNDECGCCEGIEQLTPTSTANRPGLPALVYRAGTHASFFETMKARLTGLCLGTEEQCKAGEGPYPLDGLTIRESSDPSIALLDAWATVGDVLTFYQERVANEGYLRTATERRSIVELARLVGYQPRPGVSASVHLAFTVDENAGEIIIPAGTGAKSIPGQDETTETFETSDDLVARAEWNKLSPRQARPHDIPVSRVRDIETIYLKGTSPNLELNDPLVLVVEGQLDSPIPRRVKAVTPNFEKDHTKLELQVNVLSPARFRRRVLAAVAAFRQGEHFGELDPQPSLGNEIEGMLVTLTNKLTEVSSLIELDESVDDALDQLETKPGPVSETTVAFGELSTQIDRLDGALEAELDSGPATLKAEITPILDAWEPEAKNVSSQFRAVPGALAIPGNANDTATIQANRAIVTKFYNDVFIPAIELPDIKPNLRSVLQQLRNGPFEGVDYGLQQILAAFPNEDGTFAAAGGGVDFDDEAFDPVTDPIGSGRTPTGALQVDAFKSAISDIVNAFVGSDPDDSEEDDFIDQVGDVIDDIRSALDLTDLFSVAVLIDRPGHGHLFELNEIADAAAAAGHLVLAARIRDLRDDIAARLQTESVRLFTVVQDEYSEPTDPGHEDVLTDLIGEIEGLREPFIEALSTPPVPPDPLALLSGVVKAIDGDDQFRAKLKGTNAKEYHTGFSKLEDSLEALIQELFTRDDSALKEVRIGYFEDIDGINVGFRFLKTFGDPLAEEAADLVQDLRDELHDIVNDTVSIRDTLLRVIVNDHSVPVFERIKEITEQANDNRELARHMQRLQFAMNVVVSQVTEASSIVGGGLPQEFDAAFSNLLALAPSFQTTPGAGRFSRFDVKKVLNEVFAEGSDVLARIYQSLRPESRATLYDVWRNLTVERVRPQVFALRKRASLFGHNAPKLKDDPKVAAPDVIREMTEGITLDVAQVKTLAVNVESTLRSRDDKVFALTDPQVNKDVEKPELMFLDNAYEKILPQSYVAFRKPINDDDQFRFVKEVLIHPRTDYGISTQTTRLTLTPNWWDDPPLAFSDIRNTTVLVESEELELADRPIDSPEQPDPVEGDEIELDGLYEGIQPGRLMILAGERVDLLRDEKDSEAQVEGVRSSEFVAVQAVKHGTIEIPRAIPGDKPHTTLILAEPLKHRYVRESVGIHGNVALATHGETHSEVLGSGNSSQTFQKFPLANAPLTFLPSFTPAGAASTLAIRVNDVRWDENDGLAGLKPTDRKYVTSIDDDNVTTVMFGDGVYGARLPTGLENVTAVYRSRIGLPGNVKTGQISQLASQPLGVNGVNNPLRASGGADRENRDQARRNAPLAVMALDRLVSVQDYVDFARTFAGIGKASAARLSDGRRELIHVSISGVDNDPIDRDSQLFVNLYQALQRNGDPNRALVLDVGEAVVLIIKAGVRVGPAYEWQLVEPNIRAKLLDVFGFAKRELGQDVSASEVISTIQSVDGVSSVDLDILHGVSETATPGELTSLGEKLKKEQESGVQPRARVPASLAGSKEHAVEAEDRLSLIAAIYSSRTDVGELKRLNPELVQKLREENPGGPIDDDPIPAEFTSVLVSLTWPAQLVYLNPVEPDTLLLSEIVQ